MMDEGTDDEDILATLKVFDARSALPTRPVSAEDFAPPRASKGWPATVGDFATGLFKGVPAAFEFAKDAAMAGTGDVRALQRTGERLTGAAGAQGEQFRKGREALNATDVPLPVRLNEAAGRFAASALPFVGPGAASAGEAIGRGDTAEGLGEATALLAPLGASTALPYAGRAASAAGRGAQAIAGHPLARFAARKAAEATPYVGPIVRDAQIKSAIADLAAEVRAGRAAPKAPTGPVVLPEPTPVRMGYGQESGSMRYGYTPEPAAPPVRAEPPPPSPNAGGTLIKERVPSAEQAMADALAEVPLTEPPARITTPPQADLPAGYTPRTTVPKPKPAKAELPAAHPARKAAEAKAAKPKADATMGPKGYFLREPPPVATAADATPLTADLQQLPTSWRTRTDQPIARVTKAEISQMADAMTAEGIDAAEAMRAVTSDPHLPPQVRTELMTALGKIAKAKPATPKVPLEVVKATARKTSKAAPKEAYETIYHNSPDVFKSGKPEGFDAYFGNADFVKSYPNEWGPHTYAVKVPKSKVLDLRSGSAEAREFMAKAAEKAYPHETEFIEQLRSGKAHASAINDDFYGDVWTDKTNLKHAFNEAVKGKGYDAVKFDLEYFVPHESLAGMKTAGKR